MNSIPVLDLNSRDIEPDFLRSKLEASYEAHKPSEHP